MGHFCKSGWFYLRKSNTNNKCVILDGKFVFAIVYERPRADPLSLDDCADFILYSHLFDNLCAPIVVISLYAKC